MKWELRQVVPLIGQAFSVSSLLFAALPGTVNYQLNSYGFGSGGTANSTTSNYALEGASGESGGPTAVTAAYNQKPGFIQTEQANVPKILSFDNGGSFYNKLHFVIDQQGNPNDALYALSISIDNFNTDIRYVKSDLTIGSSLSVTDYQTYAAWGSSGGANIAGLLPNTTYYLRAKATQGKFTESGYGPASSATTTNPQLSFGISVSSINLGNLLPATVVDAPQSINVSFATNAASGGDVYIGGKNAGLLSVRAASTLTAVSGDLNALSRGFGVQATAASASSGTLSKVSPYNGSAQNVGITDTNLRRILTTAGPLVGGAGSVLLKAKAAATDPAAPDYTETITMLASGSF